MLVSVRVMCKIQPIQASFYPHMQKYSQLSEMPCVCLSLLTYSHTHTHTPLRWNYGIRVIHHTFTIASTKWLISFQSFYLHAFCLCSNNIIAWIQVCSSLLSVTIFNPCSIPALRFGKRELCVWLMFRVLMSTSLIYICSMQRRYCAALCMKEARSKVVCCPKNKLVDSCGPLRDISFL